MSVTLLTPPTRPGLLAEARHLVLPDGIVSSGFPAVQATCREIGIEFDPWQQDMNRCILAKDAAGLYAADTVVISIPRQVGKTYDIGGIVFADAIIHPGTTTVWTAHRFKVSRETFDELRALAKSPKLAPHIEYDDITTAAGNECIPFRNGSRIVFAARERGAVRGFTKVRRLVLDEAQILTESAMSDLAPTQNQAENPQLILMGTPPKPTDPGETFTNLRAEALAGTSEGVLFIELSADPDCDIDDIEAWEEANPSLHTRTPVRAIRRLRKLLANDDDFRREALGIWPTGKTKSVFDLEHWAGLAVSPDQPKALQVALAVDVTPDRSRATVGFAAHQPWGRLVEVIENKAGTSWVVPLITELRQDRPEAVVMLDATGAAGSLIEPLEKAGLSVENGELIIASTRDMTQACGAFYDAVVDSTVHHVDQPVLNLALGAARWRAVGEAKAWTRKGDTDISPLVMATLALAALERPPKQPKKRPGNYW